MRMRRWTLLAAVTALVSGGEAGAQVMPRIYCPPGQASCFAAAFSYTNYATGLPGNGLLEGVPLTVMSVYLQNLQGTFGNSPTSAPSTTPFQLNTFGFFRQNGGYDNLSNTLFVNLLPDTNSFPNSGRTIGNAITGPNPFLSEDSNADPVESLSATYSTNVGGGVMGCNLGFYESPFVGWGWQTCPRTGLNGWVQFDFALWWAEQVGVPRFVTGDDFFLAIAGTTSFTGDYFCGYGQEIGIDIPVDACPDYDYAEPVVTPEPATLVLMASGLAALGAGLRKRRRRHEGPPEA